MRHAQVSGIELLIQTGGRAVVPSYSCSCSLRCFSLSNSWAATSLEEEGASVGGDTTFAFRLESTKK